MSITKTGRDLWAAVMGQGNSMKVLQAESFSGESAAENKKAKISGGGLTVKALIGFNLFVTTNVEATTYVGTIVENTAEEIEVDRWEKPGTRSQTTEVLTKPAGTPFLVVGAANPATWMALSKNNAVPSNPSPETTLKEEITNSKGPGTEYGGLNRKMATWAHTEGTNTYTLEATFTVNSHDTVPQKVEKVGIFNAQNKGRLLFETKLTSTAELVAENDALTVVETVTGT